jgi:hypothetical protein
MSTYAHASSAFVEMAHRIVWCSVATVDRAGRPRSRVLHPIWEWDGTSLTGWIATGPTPTKRAHLQHSPYVSCNYWATTHDTCTAECQASWAFDEETRLRVWDRFEHAPAPVGYDPAIVPPWKDGPLSPAFAVLRLEPWRLRVFPGSVLLGGEGDVLTWQTSEPVSTTPPTMAP